MDPKKSRSKVITAVMALIGLTVGLSYLIWYTDPHGEANDTRVESVRQTNLPHPPESPPLSESRASGRAGPEPTSSVVASVPNRRHFTKGPLATPSWAAETKHGPTEEADQGHEKLVEFIKRDWSHGIPLGQAQEAIDPEDIPLLHGMLNDDQYKAYWPTIASMIGKVSDDVNSVPIIIDYFGRADYENFTREKFNYKLDCLSWLGKLGGPLAKQVLTSAIKEEGVVTLTNAWIDSNLVEEDTTFGKREEVVRLLRRNAIYGLVFLRDPEINNLIDQLYEQEINHALQSGNPSYLCSALTDAMAMKDFIKEHSLESYLYSMSDLSIGLSVLSPYLDKYSVLDELRKRNKQQKQED